jgi:hypothetical protein
MHVAPMFESRRCAIVAQKVGIQRLKQRQYLDTRGEAAGPRGALRPGEHASACHRQQQEHAADPNPAPWTTRCSTGRPLTVPSRFFLVHGSSDHIAEFHHW